MTEMKVSNLTIDLIQEQVAVALFKQGDFSSPGKSSFTSVNIQVPVSGSHTSSELHLRRIAINGARKALEEALLVLENFSV